MRGLAKSAVLVALSFCGAGSAADSFVTEFLNSITREYVPFSTFRFEQTASRIFLAEPSYLQKWGILSADAEASYNGALRTVVLKSDNLETTPSGRKRIASAATLRARHQHSMSVRAATIIHELSHAEYSRLVRQFETEADRVLVETIDREIRPWFRRHTKSMIPWWDRVAVSEFFAYFRGDLFSFYHDELVEILTYNGVNAHDPKRCWRGKSRAGNTDSFVSPPDALRRYREVFRIKWIWVLGQDVELANTGADPFSPAWNDALWDHFEALFHPPRSRQDFVNWLNRNPVWKSRLQHCRIPG